MAATDTGSRPHYKRIGARISARPAPRALEAKPAKREKRISLVKMGTVH